MNYKIVYPQRKHLKGGGHIQSNEAKTMDESFRISKILSEHGFKDVLLLEPEDARKVLTEKRREIIELIKNERVESIRELARELERNVSLIHKDLKLLFEEGVIDFKEEGNRKIPILRHKNIIIKPLLLEET